MFKVLRVPVAQKRRVGETLTFWPLGSTSSHLRGTPVPFFGSPLPRKSACLRNPSKTNGKPMVLASLGPAWGATMGILGGPWGRLGWRLHLRLGWALGGFWGHLGPSREPQYPLSKTLPRAREGFRKLLFWTVSLESYS